MTLFTRHKPFVVPIFIPHAGCPHRCTFCNQNRTSGQSETFPTRTQLHDTINRFLSYRHDPERRTEISFYGGNFLGIPSQRFLSLLELGSGYVSNGSVHGLRFSTRPDSINAETLACIAGFPITTVEIGVQSMNDKVLKACRRGHTAQETRTAVSLLRDKPYRLGLQMMVGLPEDTPRQSLITGQEMAALGPDFVRIYPTLVLKDSPLARWFAQGRYAPMALDETVDLVKTLLALFSRDHIKVIRMGLQATDDLNTHSGVVAGPFHPAFGELVHTALWRSALQKWLTHRQIAGRALEITTHPSMLSRLRGYKNANISWIRNEFLPTRLCIRTSMDLPAEQALINGDLCYLYEIDSYLHP